MNTTCLLEEPAELIGTTLAVIIPAAALTALLIKKVQQKLV